MQTNGFIISRTVAMLKYKSHKEPFATLRFIATLRETMNADCKQNLYRLAVSGLI